jgi:hypothetical protein
MSGVTVTCDLSDLQRWADEIAHIADELPGACARALNRTGDSVATAMGRELSDEVGLGVRDVRSDFEIVHASPDNLEYAIVVPSRQTTLGEFAPHPTKQGVSARPWAHRRVFGHAFLARDEVYHRIGPERYPIEPLFGPNVAVEAARGATEQTIRDTVAEVLPERLAHEIGRVMKRRGGGGNDDGGEGVN